ncbi:hypothetical protein SESBI_41445 [Sesbania bispinosa]|nr:hypothetical protein SESBI_41445 [Sesbania bispinosa]
MKIQLASLKKLRRQEKQQLKKHKNVVSNKTSNAVENVKPDFARTEREPVVAAKEGAINMGQKRGLRKRRRQVPEHHLGPIHAKNPSSYLTLIGYDSCKNNESNTKR